MGNDFFENDYLYINQGDKTFKEVIYSEAQSVGHTTHFSMGVDMADIDQNGYTDILSVDMLPEDLKTYKTSGVEFSFQIYQNYLKNGYAPQYMQNTLQRNNGNGTFSETAYLGGIAATEWSWSPLIADFNNDGLADIHITNGILGATNDMDFINFIANETIQQSLASGMDDQDMAFIEKIPQKHTTNYFFNNNGNGQFENQTAAWNPLGNSFSSGAAYTDLDNDGDLDLVINNVNEPAAILENTTTARHLQFTLNGSGSNRYGIGTKIIGFSDSQKFTRENYPTRGYLSSVPPKIYLTSPKTQPFDSIHVIWPDQTFEVIYQVTDGGNLQLEQSDARGTYSNYVKPSTKQFLIEVPELFSYTHKENATLEFNRDPLLAFAVSNEGPGLSVADVNGDALDDVFIGGGKGQASALFLQNRLGGFNRVQTTLFELDAINEDTAQLFFDVDSDGDQDLLVVSGGNEFKTGEPLWPRLYLNTNGTFTKNTSQFKTPINASRVRATDWDEDGDMDVVITSNGFPDEYPERPKHRLFQNEGEGQFNEVTDTFGASFALSGSANDICLADVDGDSKQEWITLGDWNGIQIATVTSSGLSLLNDTAWMVNSGLWNCVQAADFDQDGDIDLVAGNWGLNSRLTASEDEPLWLTRRDFDGNGHDDTLITFYYQGEETPVASKDELVKQMPGLNKKYLSYADFAEAPVEELFEGAGSKSYATPVVELGSCYFENLGNGQFKKQLLPLKAQVSSVNAILVEDFNKDGYPDLLLGGNNFEISTQLSRLDALHGVIMLNDKKGGFYEAEGQKFRMSGAIRNFAKLQYQGETYLIVTRNNDQLLFFKFND